jgi:hypothetical protein
MEVLVDYKDSAKNETMRQALQTAARHVLAKAHLLSDSRVMPQVSMFSDDFFDGHADIKLLDDNVQKGMDILDNETGEVISADLIAACTT